MLESIPNRGLEIEKEVAENRSVCVGQESESILILWVFSISRNITEFIVVSTCPHFGMVSYATALLTHFGQWVHSPRRQNQGATPKPRWMPLPQLLYAQVVKTYHR